MVLLYKGRKIATLDDLNLSSSRVLVRIDVNSPIDPETGRILDDTRFRSHVDTIRRLLEAGAGIVLMSHQGRPTSSDFTRLSAHAAKLEEVLGVSVGFVDDVIGPEARRRIKSLSPGEILLLDNTRLVSEDFVEAPGHVHSRGIMVSTLAPLFDAYVNDAFATAHRSQASIVGFPYVLPSAAGLLMEKEVSALSRAVSREERPKVFVLGGAKVKDAVKIISYIVEEGVADSILTTGLVALLFMIAQGMRVGAAERLVIEKAGAQTVEEARRLVASGAPIMVPRDFVVEVDGKVEVVDSSSLVRGAPKDIGPATIEEYSSIIRRARIVVMRGPAGVIEDPRFRHGTRALVRAALESGAFTIFGGGHFNVIISELPPSLRQRVGHISTGGGSLLHFLSGKDLPALTALADSFERFHARG